MKAASINEIKNELSELPKPKLMALCLKLAKYRKENKELLTYLLFEAQNENQYVEDLKKEIDIGFKELNKSNTYLAKKGIRKILKLVQKHIKFSDSKQTEVELLLYFCNKFKESGLAIMRTQVLYNIYLRLINKVEKVISGLHEDLQADYINDLDAVKEL